jgi:hypothetical protein
MSIIEAERFILNILIIIFMKTTLFGGGCGGCDCDYMGGGCGDCGGCD